jgi:hypothetical protein
MGVLPVPNEDSQWADGSGLYSKALKQKSPGVPDPNVFSAFITEIDRGTAAGINLPITPHLFEPSTGVALGGTAKENGPQGSFAKQPIGKLSPMYQQPAVPPPTVGDDDYAVELAELYWASLLRDVPFTQFVDHTPNRIIKAAVDNLNDHLANYRGPVDITTKKITPRLLFRGGLPANKRKRKLKPLQTDPAAYFSDEIAGPYMSQFCIWPTSLGAQQIDQKMLTYMPGQDFMIDPNEWFRIQRGLPPAKKIMNDPMRKYMHNGRGLCAFTHLDELYQAYFVAYLVLKTWQAALNPGIPYSPYSNEHYSNQQPFGTFGGPDIAGTLGAIAKAAINAVWYQKWAVHLRHRPEAGGGLVHLWKTGAANPPGAVASFAANANFAKILDPALKMSSEKYSRPNAKSAKDKIFLLSQAFPEGSPPHPAYPTGHGTVAGACITALKFFFDCDQRVVNLVQPMVPSDDGLSLHDYTSADAWDMTINGELHKLAHNISFGHGIHAGIHWRSDTDESLLFGEEVAISFLDAQMTFYSEKCDAIIITKMDGTPKKFSN